MSQNQKNEVTGGLTNYYLVTVDHPQRATEPYTAECEDITNALKLTPEEFNVFKCIWRMAAARKGNGKPGSTHLYEAEKIAHYGNRILKIVKDEIQ